MFLMELALRFVDAMKTGVIFRSVRRPSERNKKGDAADQHRTSQENQANYQDRRHVIASTPCLPRPRPVPADH